jgi:hypothetical protein
MTELRQVFVRDLRPGDLASTERWFSLVLTVEKLSERSRILYRITWLDTSMYTQETEVCTVNYYDTEHVPGQFLERWEGEEC